MYPWDLSDLQAAAFDALVTHGTEQLAADSLGLTRRVFNKRITAGYPKLPGETTWHKRLAWRDARKLAPSPKPPSGWPFGLTDIEATTLQALLVHGTQALAAERTGVPRATFGDRLLRGAIKIPGITLAVKLNAWRQACSDLS